jgi:hypothetical protein
MEIDHLCGNPFCCEVTHLEVVTRIVNGRRGQGLNDDGTCPAHPGSRRGSGRRACRECQNLAERTARGKGFLVWEEGL